MTPLSKSASRLSLIVLILAIIGVGAVIGQSSPPSQGTGPDNLGGQPSPDEAGHILRLHQEHVRTQKQILDLQSAEIARLEKEKPEGKDENGAAARKKLQALDGRLRYLKGQLDTIMAQRPPLPPNVAQQVKKLHDLGFDQAMQMRKGFERIRQLVPNGAKDEVPRADEEGTSDTENTNDDEASVPENEKDAGNVIGTGNVKSPTHLLKLFERVHTSKTPRSNLNEYKKYRSRK